MNLQKISLKYVKKQGFIVRIGVNNISELMFYIFDHKNVYKN